MRPQLRIGAPIAVVLLLAALLGAPCPRAVAAGALSPALRPLFPVLARFLEAVEPALPAASPETAAASGGVDVNVTFTIQSQAPAGTPIPVFRFFSARSGTHFYTPSAEERDMVIARYPTIWAYEGIAYWVNPARNSQPLYRFYNMRVGSHFYTASADERDRVIATLSHIYAYDGPTYAVTPYPEAGKTAVYRFYNLQNGSHFYTADPAERDNVLGTLSGTYQYEGPAFWLGQ